MNGDEKAPERPPGRWIIALGLKLQGTGSPPALGSARRLSRPLTEAELAALNERVRSAAAAFLAEAGAVAEKAEDGWVEALANGSWAWEQGAGGRRQDHDI